jgi:hypothetical protein
MAMVFGMLPGAVQSPAAACVLDTPLRLLCWVVLG